MILLYSVRKLLTGFEIAALIAWKLTVNNATTKVLRPAMMNTVQLIFILYAKSSSHLFIHHHAIGKAMTAAMSVSFKKSFDNNITTFGTEAPKTLRTPISLILRSAIYALSPNKPRQAMKRESAVNIPKILPIRCSERYNASNEASRKL